MHSVTANPYAHQPRYETPPLTRWQKVADLVKNLWWVVADLGKCLIYGRDWTFYSACKNGHRYTVQLFLKRVDVNQETRERRFYEATPLEAAVKKSQMQIADLLIQNGADVKQALRRFPYDNTPRLLKYLSAGEVQRADPEIDFMKKLVIYGPDRFSLEVAEELVDKGLSLLPAFHALLHEGGRVQKILEQLIPLYEKTSGKTIDEPIFHSERTLLGSAVRLRHEEMVTYLLTRTDIHVDTADRLGQTPLMLACIPYSREHTWGDASRMLNLLLKERPDLSKQDNMGKTALIHACENGFFDGIHRLIDKKASLKAKDKDEMTPLMHACYLLPNCHLKALIDRCSDEVLKEKDKDGKTAVHYAIANGKSSAFTRFDMFDEATKESFVLQALGSTGCAPPFTSCNPNLIDGPVASYLIASGCGVVDGELSPAIKTVLDVAKTFDDSLPEILGKTLEWYKDSPKKDGTHE